MACAGFAHRTATVRSRAAGIDGCVTGAVMQDNSRVTADMSLDMISPTRLMIVCRLHRAVGACSVVVRTAAPASNGPAHARPRKQGLAGRGARRVPRGGRGNVSDVQREAAGRSPAPPGLACARGNRGKTHRPRGGDSAAEWHARHADRFQPCNVRGIVRSWRCFAAVSIRSAATNYPSTFDCACSHAQNWATSGSSAGAPGAIHQ